MRGFRFLCKLFTTGGPLCISALDDVPFWTGACETESGEEVGDYWGLIEDAPAEGCWPYKAASGRDYLFVQGGAEEDFYVFVSEGAFIVHQVIHAPLDHDLTRLPGDFCDFRDPVPARKLENFGGLAVLFDSTLEGKDITLKSPGYGAAFPLNRGYPFECTNMAVIEMPPGRWEAYWISYNMGELWISGALFERIGPDAEE